MDHLQQAENLLAHYLRTAWEAAGLTWQAANYDEVGEIIDHLVDGVEVLETPLPGASGPPESLARTREAWTCEQHPWREWPHDECDGPGQPVAASLSLLGRLVDVIDEHDVDQESLDDYRKMNEMTFPSDYYIGLGHREDAHYTGIRVGEALVITSLRAVLRGDDESTTADTNQEA